MPEAVRNLATDADVVERVEQELIPLLKTTRDDRNPYRERWMRYYRIWSVKHDQQGYKGRTNTYVPAGRRWIENWTRRLKRDLFPDGEWFRTPARHRDAEPRANGVQAWLLYCYRKQMRISRQATPWLRQLVTYGTSPVRAVWRLDERQAMIVREADDELRAGVRPERVTRKLETVLDYIGPTFRPVDLFAWYVWPTTCQDVDDAELIFEDMLVSRDRIKAMAKKELPSGDPLYVHTERLFGLLDEAIGARDASRGDGQTQQARDKFDAAARRLADKGFTHPLDEKLPPSMRPVDLTECRWLVDLGDGCKPYLVAIGHDAVVLRVQEEPFLHYKPWWLAGKFVEVMNEFYGRGLPEVFDFMQYLTNDLMNQTADALTWAVNPISVIDMNAVQDPGSLRAVPGAKWLAPPGAVSFTNPPQGPAQAGLAALGQVIGLADSYTNVTPAGALGTAQRGRSRSQTTAAGTQLTLAEFAVDIRDVVENIEAQVLERHMMLSHSLSTQFLDREVTLKVAGIDGAKLIETPIGVADLVGDYDFEWLGSANTQNSTVRATQDINFLGMISKLPPEMLDAQGIEIDLKYLLRSIYGAGGLGHRDADKVVRDKVKDAPMDPRLENDLYRAGRGADLRVSPKEDHALHIRTHEILDREELPWLTRQQVQAHIQEHLDAMIAAEVQKMVQQQQQAMAAMGPPPGMPGAPGPNGNGMGGGGMGGRLPPPIGPGRLRQTNSLEDVFRSLPRGEAM